MNLDAGLPGMNFDATAACGGIFDAFTDAQLSPKHGNNASPIRAAFAL